MLTHPLWPAVQYTGWHSGWRSGRPAVLILLALLRSLLQLARVSPPLFLSHTRIYTTSLSFHSSLLRINVLSWGPFFLKRSFCFDKLLHTKILNTKWMCPVDWFNRFIDPRFIDMEQFYGRCVWAQWLLEMISWSGDSVRMLPASSALPSLTLWGGGGGVYVNKMGSHENQVIPWKCTWPQVNSCHLDNMKIETTSPVSGKMTFIHLQ